MRGIEAPWMASSLSAATRRPTPRRASLLCRCGHGRGGVHMPSRAISSTMSHDQRRDGRHRPRRPLGLRHRHRDRALHRRVDDARRLQALVVHLRPDGVDRQHGVEALGRDEPLLQRQRVRLDHRRERDAPLARDGVQRRAQAVRRAGQDERQLVQRVEPTSAAAVAGRPADRSGSCRRRPGTVPSRAASAHSGRGWRCPRAHRRATPRPDRWSLPAP